MKLLTSTFFAVLLIGSAGSCYGQEIGTLNYDDGSIYVGELRYGVPNGQGTMTYSSGTVTVGEFKDGTLNGQGSAKNGRGYSYIGQWKNGQYDGQGTLVFGLGDFEGLIYTGEFKEHKQSGEGTYTWPNGDVYVGEVKDNQLNGQGTMTWADGSVYVGEFRDNQRNGQGTYIYENGIVQNGIWLKDAFIVANNIDPVMEAPPVVRVAPVFSDSKELLQAASGSGFSVTYDGYLVTNNHVIEGCEAVRVHSNGRIIDATVISRDPGNDLAVLKADFRPSAVFALRESNPQLMQDIYVAGYPFGVNLSSSVKVTKGIVSSLTGLGNNFSNIQIDAAIQPGNSGGPIFDDNGNVLGVAVSSLDIEYALDKFDAIPQNTNFGIKANIVSNLLSSNGIETTGPSTAAISTTQLGALATDATYYLSCWMTTAQIQKMSSTKVLFNELRN